jgi:hypothetical protein
MRRGRNGWRLSICCAFVAVVSSGCSVLFMDSVPMQWTPSQTISCSGYSLPVLDAAVAALNIFSITMTVVDPYGMEYRAEQGAIASVAAVLAGIVATSAVLGFCMAKECHDARDVRENWLDLGSIEQDVLEEKWRDLKGLPALGGPE